jgi:ppGpp synthetase/RelA/SpoT-type nucleotidyltranferase
MTMAGSAARRHAFVQEYPRRVQALEQAAKLAELLVSEILADQGLEVSQVSSRVKALPSVRSKLREKKYTNPQIELTDCIGVRVLTYYASDVDIVAQTISSNLRVNKSRSVDKRTALALREFGYRSVHLIARLGPQRAKDQRLAPLSKFWFEVQIRSLLEHAWAAIEHEIVYKSRTDYPEQTLRRFAALAGALEILDREFHDMRLERERLIVQYRQSYAAGRLLDNKLDTARLVAFMENAWPHGPGWMPRQSATDVLPSRYEADCVSALAAVKLTTARKLGSALKHPAFLEGAKRFASAEGIPYRELSHLALVAILVGLRSWTVLNEYLPDLVYDPAITASVSPDS